MSRADFGARLAPLALVALAGACDAGAADPASSPPWALDAFPAASGTIVDLAAGAPADPIAGKRAELGRLLFYDPILSADGETACATCHSELWGMSDGLAVSVGVGAGLLTGPGRAGPSVLTRNAPSLWNVAFRRYLFWDGRSQSLEEQVLSPLAAPLELDRDARELVADLAAIPEYAKLFAAAFPADPAAPGAAPTAVTLPHVQAAIAAFERTLVSDASLYDGWVAGDRKALDAEAVRGMQIFADAGCARCHVPPTFDSETFAARHVAASSDRGRAAISGAPADEGAFKVPSLRNLRNTGPYFHDGSVADLGAAVDHELAESGVVLTSADRRALVAFLTTALVDRSREPASPATVPSGLPVPEDGFRIVR